MEMGDSDTGVLSVNDDKRNKSGTILVLSIRASWVANGINLVSDRDDDERSSRVNSTELDSSPISQICSVCHSRFPVITTGSSKPDRKCAICRSNRNIVSDHF